MTPEEVLQQFNRAYEALNECRTTLGDIYRALKAAGISAPYKSQPKGKPRTVNYEELLADSQAGLSQREIAKKHGMTSGGVNKALRKQQQQAKDIESPVHFTFESYKKEGSLMEYKLRSDGLMRFKPYPEAEWQAAKRTAKELESEGYVKSTCPPENS